MTAFAVVDTNVVVAGLVTADAGAPTARILDAMLAGRIGYVVSIDLIAEYRRVLLRPKLARLHGLAEAEIDEILVRLTLNGAVRELAGKRAAELPRGDAHLGRLLDAEPNAVLVTGDAAVVRAVRGRAISPRDFAEQRLG